jgi:hypothetical protein
MDNNNQDFYQNAGSLAKNFDDNQFIKVLSEHEDFLNILRRELRGEQLHQDSEGNMEWVQVDKPMFVKLDQYNKPLKVKNKKTDKIEYVANEDAVNEVLNILKSCGFNPITPFTNISEDEIIDDLLEMESKVAVLLFARRRVWGLEKPDYPVAVGKMKMLIKDARYRAVNGSGLKAVRSMTSRIEHSADYGGRKPTITERMSSKAPYG